MDFLATLILILAILFGLALYLIPAIIAGLRNHHNKIAIIVLNILAGWTVLGWFGSLIWSLTSPAKSE